MIKIKEPEYSAVGNKVVCVNAKEVIESIKELFQTETYRTIANRANVHMQSVLRWVSANRAEEQAMRRLMLTFEQEDNIDNVLLKDATPIQLKKQCQLIGWDKVINS